MKKRLMTAAVCVVIAISGCGGGLQNKIVGTWKFDTSTLKMDGLTDEMKKNPMFTAQIKPLADARVEIKADGTYMGTGMGSNGGGHWTLTDHNLTMKSDKGDDKSNPTLTVNDDGTRIHASGPGPTGSGKMEMDMVKADK